LTLTRNLPLITSFIVVLFVHIFDIYFNNKSLEEDKEDHNLIPARLRLQPVEHHDRKPHHRSVLCSKIRAYRQPKDLNLLYTTRILLPCPRRVATPPGEQGGKSGGVESTLEDKERESWRENDISKPAKRLGCRAERRGRGILKSRAHKLNSVLGHLNMVLPDY
jgi:hypothetical protein